MEAQDCGIVYVLTNVGMPDLVKIGMTERSEIDARLNELNTTGVPFPFKCEFACRVEKSQCEIIEKALHKAFAPNRVNPRREFFKIDTSQAIAILELFDKGDMTNEVNKKIDKDVTDEEKAAAKSFKKKRPSLDFFEMGLEKGDILVYKPKPEGNITCTIEDSKHVTYDGKPTSLTKITTKLLGKSYDVQPTPFWKVQKSGRDLSEIYEETYPPKEDME